MIRSLLIAVVLLFAVAAPAHAQAALTTCQGVTIPVTTKELLCSRNFYASGTCDGQDQLAMLAGPRVAATQMVQPWEPVPITIVGYQIVLFEGAMQYVFAGNSYTPDIMGWLGSGQSAHGDFYPAGTGFAFPAAGADVHLDLHFSCRTGSFQGFYTVFYTVDPVAVTH